MAEEAPESQKTASPSRRGVLKRYLTALQATSLVFGIVGVIFGVYQWYTQVQQERIHREETTKQNQRNEELQGQRDELAARNVALEDSTNTIATLNLISSSVSQLPGLALINNQLQPSGDAARNNAKDFAATVDKCIPNLTAINSLQQISKTLVYVPREQPRRVQVLESSIVPIIFAACQSPDPAVAGGALVVSGYCANQLDLSNSAPGTYYLGKESRNTQVLLQTAFNRGRFLAVEFDRASCDFSGFNFDLADFEKSTFANASLSDNHLGGAKFALCRFTGTKLTNAQCLKSVGLDENGAKSPTSFEGAEFVKCDFLGGSTRFDETNLRGAQFTQCGIGLKYDGSLDQRKEVARIKLDACDLRSCTFNQVRGLGLDFHDCMLGAANHKRRGTPPTEPGQTRFEGVDLTSCNFTQSEALPLTKPKFEIADSKFFECGFEAFDFGEVRFCSKAPTQLRGDGSTIPAITFNGCRLKSAKLRGAVTDTLVEFTNCNEARAVAFGSGMSKLKFTNCALEGSCFGHIAIEQSQFSEVNLNWARVGEGGEDSRLARLKASTADEVSLVRKRFFRGVPDQEPCFLIVVATIPGAKEAESKFRFVRMFYHYPRSNTLDSLEGKKGWDKFLVEAQRRRDDFWRDFGIALPDGLVAGVAERLARDDLWSIAPPLEGDGGKSG